MGPRYNVKMMKKEETEKEIMYGEREIKEAVLICFPNPKPTRDYEISIEFPEFTCKCPFSGYPDFANLKLI